MAYSFWNGLFTVLVVDVDYYYQPHFMAGGNSKLEHVETRAAASISCSPSTD